MAKGDWIDEIKADYMNSTQCLLHNVSPPGAGKTHLWRSIMDKERQTSTPPSPSFPPYFILNLLICLKRTLIK
jgi:hypothetical protein